MIIIGVIMHHYTRGGRFHFIEGGSHHHHQRWRPLNHHYPWHRSLESHYLWIIIIILIIITPRPTICTATLDQHRQRPLHYHSV